jgi:glycerophosphoryl diester phosphodiesterase
MLKNMPIKIFSHRGLATKKSQENKVESFKNAYKNGLRAIELDIWYLKNQLILKHNRPNNFNNLDCLEDLLENFKNDVEYWLDFKNLNPKNCDQVIKKIKELVDQHQIKLNNLNFAPFITDLKKAEIIYHSIRKYFGKKAKIIAVIEKLLPKNYQTFYQQLKVLDIYGLSIQWKNINPEFRVVFKDIKIFAWTVNEQKVANFLEKIGVENIASDTLVSTKK